MNVEVYLIVLGQGNSDVGNGRRAESSYLPYNIVFFFGLNPTTQVIVLFQFINIRAKYYLNRKLFGYLKCV